MDKNIYKFIFYMLFFVFFESKGQIMFVDDFENGQLGNWENTAHWNITNQSPVAGNYSLHHNLTGIRSDSYISRKINTSGFNNGLITWRFKLKNGNWIFGATEQFCFYLVADRADLTTSNGYAIGLNLSGADNILKICRIENGKAVQDIVLTDLIWKAGMLLDVEVTHEYGLWKVRYREGNAGTWSRGMTGNERLMNLVFSDIGFFFKFNTAHGGQILIDDISMSYLNTAPSVHEVRSVGRNEILVLFSEAMAPIPLLEPGNYRIKTAGGSQVNVLSVRKTEGDTAGVWLRLNDLFDWNLHISIDNLTDNENVPLTGNDFDFTFIPSAQFGDIVFNELMADPVPVVHLPDEEFLEVKSTCNFAVNIKNWILEVNGKQKVLGDKTIEPGGYVIICGTGGNAVWSSYGNPIEVTGLSLSNNGFGVKLFSAASVLIDSFNYKPALHRKGYANGGYSLERIDPMRNCGAYSNWETSISDKGGTPGTENSVFRDNTDNIPPTVTSVIISSPLLLEVILSEIPDKGSITGNVFSFVPSMTVPDSILFDPDLRKFLIYFADGVIKNGMDYGLVITGMADECGNQTPVEHHAFSYYLPVPGDLLISEILFNPFPGGVDFVEIYNHSGRKIELSEIYLASRNDSLVINSRYPLSIISKPLLDSGYAAFTSDPDALLRNYYSSCPDCIFKMTRFPAYNLDEGWVVLLNKQMEVIDEFHYKETMHHPMIGDVKGISLERTSFSQPTDNPLNWHSASKTVGFASPGYMNSAREVVAEINGMVLVEPKIFSPNDDGFNDRLMIKLAPGEPDWMVNIRIYNDYGLEIRRLANNVLIGVTDIIEWDGMTENHRKAGLGIYIIKVELFRLQSRTNYFKAACVLTDRLE